MEPTGSIKAMYLVTERCKVLHSVTPCLPALVPSFQSHSNDSCSAQQQLLALSHLNLRLTVASNSVMEMQLHPL